MVRVNVIDELRDLQRRDGWVTDGGLDELSQRIDRPVHELYGVASFYPEFHLSAPPRVTMNHADLLRIPKATLDRFVANHPDVAACLTRTADRRRVRDQVRPGTGDVAPRTLALQQYVDQQLYEGRSLLPIDLDRCTRCDECVRGCAASHGGVGRLIRDGQRFDKYLVPTACRSCHDPECLGGCPVDAIHRTAEGGLAIVVEDHCGGCGFCFGQDMDANHAGTGCPYGNISPVPVTRVDPKTHEQRPGRVATVCDLDGCTPEGVEPSCVYACPPRGRPAGQRPRVLRQAAAAGGGGGRVSRAGHGRW